MRDKPMLHVRMRRIMKEMGWTKNVQLAAAAGATRQAAGNWLNRQNPDQTISAEYALNLQDATGFSARWIVTGDPPEMLVKLTPEEREFLAAWRVAPEAKRQALAILLES